MKISEKFRKGKVVLSFEVFPPKKNSASPDSIIKTLNELSTLNPDYISVTYGAGGNIADRSTCKFASMIKNKYGIEAMAHLTCVNSSKNELQAVLDDFKNENIENILALRGDIVPDVTPKEDFKFASDMISEIRSNPSNDFCIAGACYPEGHSAAESLAADIRHLKTKVDSGAEFLVTQLFFDNKCFHDFREKLDIAGINVPVTAGIMPVTNANQIERMVTMCGASLPQKFVKIIQKFADNKQALMDAGIAYAIDQIVDLISNGADGIHIYTMNNPYVAKKIKESIETLL